MNCGMAESEIKRKQKARLAKFLRLEEEPPFSLRSPPWWVEFEQIVFYTYVEN
jgi:hypothetical protein